MASMFGVTPQKSAVSASYSSTPSAPSTTPKTTSTPSPTQSTTPKTTSTPSPTQSTTQKTTTSTPSAVAPTSSPYKSTSTSKPSAQQLISGEVQPGETTTPSVTATQPTVAVTNPNIQGAVIGGKTREQVVNPNDPYAKQVADYQAWAAGAYGKVSIPLSKLTQAVNVASSAKNMTGTITTETGEQVEVPLDFQQRAAASLQGFFTSGKGNYGVATRPLAYYGSVGLSPPKIETVSERPISEQIRTGTFYTPGKETPETAIAKGGIKPQSEPLFIAQQEYAKSQGLILTGSVPGGGFLAMKEEDWKKQFQTIGESTQSTIPYQYYQSTPYKGTNVAFTILRGLDIMEKSPNFMERQLAFITEEVISIPKTIIENPIQATAAAVAYAVAPLPTAIVFGGLGTVNAATNIKTGRYGAAVVDVALIALPFKEGKIKEPAITDIRVGRGIQLAKEEKSVILENVKIKYETGNLFKTKKEANIKAITISKEVMPSLFKEVTGAEIKIGKSSPQYGIQATTTKQLKESFVSIGQATFNKGDITSKYDIITLGKIKTTPEGFIDTSSITSIKQGKYPSYLIASKTAEIYREGESSQFISIGTGISRGVKLEEPIFKIEPVRKIFKKEEPINMDETQGAGLVTIKQPKLVTGKTEFAINEAIKQIKAIEGIKSKTIRLPIVTSLKSSFKTEITPKQISSQLISPVNIIKPFQESKSLLNQIPIQSIETKQTITQIPALITSTKTTTEQVTTNSIPPPEIPIIPPFSYTPGTIPGRYKQKSGVGLMFSRFTPSLRGIEYGKIEKKSLKELNKQMFSGMEIRGLSKDIAQSLGLIKPKRRKR